MYVCITLSIYVFFIFKDFMYMCMYVCVCMCLDAYTCAWVEAYEPLEEKLKTFAKCVLLCGF